MCFKAGWSVWPEERLNRLLEIYSPEQTPSLHRENTDDYNVANTVRQEQLVRSSL